MIKMLCMWKHRGALFSSLYLKYTYTYMCIHIHVQILYKYFYNYAQTHDLIKMLCKRKHRGACFVFLYLSYTYTYIYIYIYSILMKMLCRRTQSSWECIHNMSQFHIYIDRKKPPSPGGFPIYYVSSSRTVSKRTPLEDSVTNSSRGVLLLTVLDEGT